MTDPREPDAGLEALLRNAMHAEADEISPAGDGLGRIQQRLATRRARRWWLRPLAAVGTAAVAGAAGFTAYALTSQPDTGNSVLSNPPSTVPSSLPSTPAASISPQASPATVTFPPSAFYPFTSAAAEHSWEAQNGPAAQPWVVDPIASAKRFVADYVGADSVSTVVDSHADSGAASVTLGRSLSDGTSSRTVKVTTVRLARFGKAWLVVGADDPNGNLRLSSPAPGARVHSPLIVSGPAYGADESVQVDVRAIGRPFLTATRGQASFGSGTPSWTTTVAFGPSGDPRGAVVVIENSAADGGPARIAVNGVTFDSESTGYPAYFYGVKNARITKFSARTGAAISYLTDAQPGVTPSDPQLVADRVYYLAGTPTCLNALRSVPIGGGRSAVVGTAQPGYAITSFAVSADQTRTSLFESACAPATNPQGLLVSRAQGASSAHTVTFPAFPPVVTGDPSWEADGTHVDAVIRTGNMAHPARIDAFGATTWSDGTDACSLNAGLGLPMQLETDSSGAVWILLEGGDTAQVARCLGSSTRVMFTVATTAPSDLDVAGSGSAVLVTDAQGQVWRWTQGGNVEQLHPSVALQQATW